MLVGKCFFFRASVLKLPGKAVYVCVSEMRELLFSSKCGALVTFYSLNEDLWIRDFRQIYRIEWRPVSGGLESEINWKKSFFLFCIKYFCNRSCISHSSHCSTCKRWKAFLIRDKKSISEVIESDIIYV